MADLQRSFGTLSCPPFLEADNDPEPKAGDNGEATEWRARVDATLLDACICGDSAAWRRLHRLCFPRAAAFLRKLGVGQLDLDDAAREVFVQLFRYLPRFRREAELSTWLYRICISQARSVRRRKRLSHALSRLLSCAPSPTLVSTPSLPDEVVRRRVEAALSRLSDGDRTVFVLYEMEGVPGKRIAEIVAPRRLACGEGCTTRAKSFGARSRPKTNLPEIATLNPRAAPPAHGARSCDLRRSG
jgi:RNA polymerase sigma factor (sigma-70 family)